MKNDTMSVSSVPAFIPDAIKEAYWKSSKDIREELSLLDPAQDQFGDNGDNLSAPIRESRLSDLALMQKGIDADRLETQRTKESISQREVAFAADVQTAQDNFFSTFRDTFTKNLMTEVEFSTDPKMQNLLASQQVALLGNALDDGSAGVFARKHLADAGINFDHTKATQLLKAVETAAVAVTTHKRMVGPDGQPLNKVELNKANSMFERAGREFQAFAADIIKQEAALVSKGTSEAVKKEAEKIKVAEKARPSTNGTPTAAKVAPRNPHPYGSIKYYEHQADEIMRAQKNGQPPAV